MEEKQMKNEAVVCVVGLGYVGQPLAEAFSKSLRVIGLDMDEDKIRKLNENNGNNNILFTTDPSLIKQADFVIIAVPTPVTKSKEPDLSYVKSAAKTVGKNLKKGSVVVLESTVYPGVTEEIVKPILEEESGLKCGEDFKIGYSPERINPGDEEHSLERITKIVAGMDEETTEMLAELYGTITRAYKAKDIRTAEAAKVIENVQRDLNIALMNELSLIFDKMGLDTKAVLEAAGTKWNFHRYSPGLVGGHCIPVDPYYLVYKAKELGYHPQVILAGRAINDYMPKHVAEMAIKGLNEVGKVIKGSKVLIMGLTYKENVSDTRESPVKEMVKELKEFGVEIYGYDSLLSEKEIESFGVIALSVLSVKVDCVVVAVVHDEFKNMKLGDIKKFMNDKPVLIDVRGMFDGEEVKRKGFYYRSL
ncbi:MAG: nucleotide sugar dehydrogenase [Methanosarcinales archaeon]|nr:nucleotide sugar dehydrogenase [Methanosarcinales archaeon]